MKRDMDLIRDLLFYFERGADERKPLPTSDVTRDGVVVPKDEVNYHIKLLHEARLVEATKFHSGWVVHSLTWSDHEFLDAARDDTHWNRAKEIVQEKGGGLMIDVLKGVLTQLARQAAGLN